MNFASSLTREPFTKPPKTKKLPSLKSLITWSSRALTCSDAFYADKVCHSKHKRVCRWVTYREVYIKPRVAVGIEKEYFTITVFSLKTSVENYVFVGAHRHSMMGNASRAAASRIHKFPFNLLAGIFILSHSKDTSQIQSPHGRDGPLFQVAATVHVKASYKN